MENIVQLDRELFVFLNGLGSPTFDKLWILITKQVYWTPIFIFMFYLLQKKLGWKNFGYYILFTALLIVACDQTANLFKGYFERLRPCYDPELMNIIRIPGKKSSSFSFFSGHAINSMATTFFAFMILKRYYNHAYLLFLFPFVFAYSRIYLGLHFPGDIITGYLFGITFGFFCYKLYQKYILRTT